MTHKTSWFQYYFVPLYFLIEFQIRTRGTDEDYAELTDEVPLIDIFGPLGGVDIAKEQKGDFKIFKSHYTFEQECKK